MANVSFFAETIYVIRKILNPSKIFDRVKFKVTNNDPTEPLESYENQIVEDPYTFDNPQTQTVEFPEEGQPIADDGYSRYTADIISKPGKDSKKADEMDNFEVEMAQGDETAEGKGALVQVGDKELEPYDPNRELENYH